MLSHLSKIFLLLICLTAADAWWFWSSKVNCSVSQWSAWSSLNSAGKQTRERRIMRYNQNGGAPCPTLSETRVSTDCKVTSWSTWSSNFGFGQQTRERSIITRPTGIGKQCPVLSETRFTGVAPSINETALNIQGFLTGKNGHFFSQSGNAMLGGGFGSIGGVNTVLLRDLVLILDSSGSIGPDQFKVAKEQLSKLIGLLCPISPFDRVPGSLNQYNQAAMLTFSTNVVENFDFDTYRSTVSIQNAIMNATYEGQATCTNKAFDSARNLFQPSKGVRDKKHAKREVLILTDGMSTNKKATFEAVEKLKHEADIYGLMIGKFTTGGMTELTKYVSAPKNTHLFYAQDFQKLKALLDLIEDKKINAVAEWCAPFNLF